MGLFSTLLETGPTDESGDTTKKAPSSLALPTVVQMFIGSPFELPRDEDSANVLSHAHLTYQAVQIDPKRDIRDQAKEQSTGLRQRKTSVAKEPPTLGVWNCRVSLGAAVATEKAAITDEILKIPSKDANVFCWKVDLSKLHSVEPTLSALQEALIRYLIGSTDYSSSKQAAVQPLDTTSLFQLRSAHFGLAAEDQGNEKVATTAPSETDRNVRVALQIAATWPIDLKVDDTYRHQQALVLMYYHLRRYAAELGASLVFVEDSSLKASGIINDQDNEDSTRNLISQPTLTLAQLGAIWKGLASGEAVWDEKVQNELLEVGETQEASEGKENDVKATSLIYGGEHNNDELIETALLRNAQYPGHWDAAKDSLWKIFPPEVEVNQISNPTSQGSTGEQGWLSELRDSVAVNVDTTATTTTPNRPTQPAPSSTPDVSDFFSSLLEK